MKVLTWLAMNEALFGSGVFAHGYKDERFCARGALSPMPDILSRIPHLHFNLLTF